MLAESRRSPRVPQVGTGSVLAAIGGGLLLAGMIGLSAAAAPAPVAAPCNSDQARALFELESLKSELMVLATDCHDQDQYNAFVQKYQPELATTEHELDDYFKRAYGKRAQQAHDAYVTSLANSDAHSAHALGTDFCPRNGALFQEVMALRGPADLPAYAAAKDVVPADLGACESVPAPAAPGPVHRARTHRVHAR
jgi:hypothetical protein